MATRNEFSLSIAERRSRRFSENFRKEKVRELELGLTRISELCRQYDVSDMTVYRWMSKFGSMKKKKEKLIVESQSDTVHLLEMKKKIAELERLVGQKQILIDFQQKMIELAEEKYGIDIKKKFSGDASSTFGKSGK